MDQLWEKVIGLDLKSVSGRYGSRKSWWWHLFRSPAQIESEYRQFLFLLVSNPERALVPWSQDLNEFWRLHILDARKYAADCNVIAGRPLPYHRTSPKGSRAHARECEEVRPLYLAAFGEKVRKQRQSQGERWPGADTTQVFSDTSSGVRDAHHGWGHCGADGHHIPGHHNDAGIQASSDHGGAGHSIGGHGGHSCGGHSSCGGHAGCGGHGH